MRYGQIRDLDVANGIGVRTSIFVTGCTHDCYNCFNKEYQDFKFGKVWTDNETKRIIDNLKPQRISGLSILGGEPMQNTKWLTPLLREVRVYMRDDQDIWLWSGYTWEEIVENQNRCKLLQEVDVLVDGLYVEKLKDLNLKFRGSSNQRIIDVKKSFENNKPIIINEEEWI